jgi:3-mercaptopyruvate sulfurtransferase SseA
LQDKGLENVWHLEGGFTAWRDAVGPVAARPTSKPEIQAPEPADRRAS